MVYFGSIIKDNKIPVVVPVEELSSGWQNRHVLYTFTNEYCNHLDELSDALRRELHIAESNVGESDVDSESDDDDDDDDDDGVQQIVIHEVELTASEHRRSVVRNVEGQILTSYTDLLNPRPARRQPRQTQHLTQVKTELQAERNFPEFDQTAENTNQV